MKVVNLFTKYFKCTLIFVETKNLTPTPLQVLINTKQKLQNNEYQKISYNTAINGQLKH
jgi:hypothetical protein